MNERPLILTLKLDEASFDWFQALRTRWFPPERNVVPAHLTLFHALPGAELEVVRSALHQLCGETKPMLLHVGGPTRQGSGFAYEFHAPELKAFRATLAERFEPWLTRQDRQSFRPHVTVQNKAPHAEVLPALAQMQAEWEPFDVAGEGVLLWRYQGGPWEALDEIAFSG